MASVRTSNEADEQVVLDVKVRVMPAFSWRWHAFVPVLGLRGERWVTDEEARWSSRCSPRGAVAERCRFEAVDVKIG